jgi:phage recombination protein Bet
MNNENKEIKEIIVKNNHNEVVEVNDDLIVEYMNAFGIAKQLTDEQKKQFINVAKAFQLNPFKREIHCIAYNGTLSLIVGYEVYLKRAERSGKLAGWKIWTEGKLEDRSLKAICEIWRKDWATSLKHEVYYSEYARNTNIWKEKPYTMIKKVAIAQAFRLAFPDELGGMPYTQEEQWENGVIEKIENNHQVVKQEIPIIDAQVETEIKQENIEKTQKIEEIIEKNEDISLKNAEKLQNQEKKADNYKIVKELNFPTDFEIEEKLNKNGNYYWIYNVKINDKKKLKLYLFDKKIYDKMNAINGKMDFYYVEKERNGKIYNEIVDIVESIPF